MIEQHNFFKDPFHEFFLENHPNFVCSFPTREEYYDWLESYSSQAVDYWQSLIDSDIDNGHAQMMAKDEFLKQYKFSPYHHFLSIFEENFPDIYEYYQDTSMKTFLFLSFFFLCEDVFKKYPSGEEFAYSDDMDDEIIEILTARFQELKLLQKEY